jgi:hypothetical protein
MQPPKHRALVGNAGDPAQVAAARETETIRREREANELRAVVGTVDGGRVLWRILADCGAFRQSESLEPQYLAYREGQRAVALGLIADINAVDADAYLRMQQDNIHLQSLRVTPKTKRRADDPNESSTTDEHTDGH